MNIYKAHNKRNTSHHHHRHRHFSRSVYTSNCNFL